MDPRTEYMPLKAVALVIVFQSLHKALQKNSSRLEQEVLQEQEVLLKQQAMKKCYVYLGNVIFVLQMGELC